MLKFAKQNILIDSAGQACLSDVGFSTLTPSGESQFDWAKVGADGHRWAAPELFKSGKLSEQSDVFCYGFIAAEVRSITIALYFHDRRSLDFCRRTRMGRDRHGGNEVQDCQWGTPMST